MRESNGCSNATLGHEIEVGDPNSAKWRVARLAAGLGGVRQHLLEQPQTPWDLPVGALAILRVIGTLEEQPQLVRSHNKLFRRSPCEEIRRGL